MLLFISATVATLVVVRYRRVTRQARHGGGIAQPITPTTTTNQLATQSPAQILCQVVSCFAGMVSITDIVNMSACSHAMKDLSMQCFQHKSRFSDEELALTNQRALKLVQLCQQRLRHVTISSRSFRGNADGLVPFFFMTSSLTSIEFSSLQKIDTHMLSRIVDACSPTLRHLTLCDLRSIDNRFFTRIFTLPQLTHLILDRLPRISEDAVAEMLTHLPELRHLQLKSFPLLSEKLSLALCTTTHLDVLNISNSVVVHESFFMGLTSRQVTINDHRMSYVTLANILTSLVEYLNSWPNSLTRLSLNGCELTQTHFDAIVCNTPHLQYLNVSQTQITNLSSIFACYNDITELYLSKTFVEEESLIEMLRRCTRLKRLAVFDTPRVSERWLLSCNPGWLSHLQWLKMDVNVLDVSPLLHVSAFVTTIPSCSLRVIVLGSNHELNPSQKRAMDDLRLHFIPHHIKLLLHAFG